MSISMKRYNDTIITPKDDRILFDQIFDDYGLIYGGSATMAASNKIHVGAARGFVKGTEVIIEAEDIAVNLSDSGTKNGRLKIVMDLADTETPIKFESEVASSFPALEQDANINYDNGRYEVVFATYKATETTISSVTLVMPTMQSVKAKMQGITQSLTIMDDLNVHMIVGKGSYGWYHTNSVFVGKIKSINITHISIVGDASNNYEPSYHNNINYDNGGITFDIINGFLTMKFSDERIVNLIPFGTVVRIKGVILR